MERHKAAIRNKQHRDNRKAQTALIKSDRWKQREKGIE